MGLVKKVIEEIENKSREFYEFVLPPVDMHLTQAELKIVIDIPGFAKKDIKLRLHGDILSIKATKERADAGSLVCNQRPNLIDKKIRLPIDIKEGQKVESATYEHGVLTLVIPIKKKGQDISID